MRRSTGIPFLILALLSAALAAPGDRASSRASWYEGPQLFVMTGFIANTTSGTWGADFITPGEWSPQKQLDSVAKAFQDAGATGVIFYDKWHDGLVPHRTKYTSFMTERDLVGETIKALRQHGMKIVVYYSVGLDANPDPRFQDWTCRDANGKPMGRAFPGDWKSFYSPYRQYVINHLVELLKKYGPFQGFFLDLYTQPVPLSRDKYTAKAFEQAYGKPVEQATPAEAREFNIKTLAEFLQEIRKAITAVQPGINFTFNGAGRADGQLPKRAHLVDSQADWLSIEGHRRERIDSIATVGENWDRPFDAGILLNTSWYVPMSDQAPRASMSEAEAVISAATVFVRGGNVYGAMTPGHSGIYDPNGDLRLLRAIGAWLQQNRQWIQGASPYAEIGVVRGDPSSGVAQVPALGKIWHRAHRHNADNVGIPPGSETDLTLRHLGYLTQLTGSAFAKRPIDPGAYRLTVIPENAPISQELAAKLRDYSRERADQPGACSEAP